MTVPQAKWVQLDESYFYAVRLHRNGLQLPEWTIVGEVHRREVSATSPPAYFVVLDMPGKGKVTVGRSLPKLLLAQAVVEGHAKLTSLPRGD